MILCQANTWYSCQITWQIIKWKLLKYTRNYYQMVNMPGIYLYHVYDILYFRHEESDYDRLREGDTYIGIYVFMHCLLLEKLLCLYVYMNHCKIRRVVRLREQRDFFWCRLPVYPIQNIPVYWYTSMAYILVVLRHRAASTLPKLVWWIGLKFWPLSHGWKILHPSLFPRYDMIIVVSTRHTYDYYVENVHLFCRSGNIPMTYDTS